MTIVGELIAAGMAQHVGMDSEGKFGGFARSLNHPQEPSCGDWRACLSHEHVRRCPLQWP
ncbi:MAG: hypothetical protein WCD69_14160 [Xanthobacteraceae bacterium]